MAKFTFSPSFHAIKLSIFLHLQSRAAQLYQLIPFFLEHEHVSFKNQLFKRRGLLIISSFQNLLGYRSRTSLIIYRSFSSHRTGIPRRPCFLHINKFYLHWKYRFYKNYIASSINCLGFISRALDIGSSERLEVICYQISRKNNQYQILGNFCNF